MKSNANKTKENNKSSIGNKIIFKAFTIVIVVCIFIIANNTASSSYNNNTPVKAESSMTVNSDYVHSGNKPLTVGSMEYLISDVEYQKDEGNPLLGKDSEYTIITMKVKNNSSKTEIFDAFDMILQASVNGQKRNIRNISDTTIFNIPSGIQKDIKLIYIVPNNSTDIHIISEKNSKIDLEI